MIAPRRLVLLGAGHAHVLALREFMRAPPPDTQITLITREILAPYSGMLPGVVAGHYAPREALIDTGPLARALGATLLQDEVVALDPMRRLVFCASGMEVAYDLLSIDTGSRPHMETVPGARDHAVPVKPIDGFLERSSDLDDLFRKHDHRLNVAVVGGGAGGTELAFAINHRLRKLAQLETGNADNVCVTLVTGSHGLLPGFSTSFRTRVLQALSTRQVQLRADVRVTRIDASQLELDDGAMLPADKVFWATQAAPGTWIAKSGVATDDGGFLKVLASLRSSSHPEIFGAGDTIAFGPRNLPKSGVYAVRQGPVLADNLRRLLDGRDTQDYVPQTSVLYLLSTGDKHAIASWKGTQVAGKWCWFWKDWIDRKFVGGFSAR